MKFSECFNRSKPLTKKMKLPMIKILPELQKSSKGKMKARFLNLLKLRLSIM